MTIYFYDGKPLVFGNLVGVDEECCCDPECCCGPCIRFEWELTGWADTLLNCGCPDVNGTYTSPNADAVELAGGGCRYFSTVLLEAPLAACDGVVVLFAEMLCPVDGKIQVTGYVAEIAKGALPVDPLGRGRAELLARLLADEPPVGSTELFRTTENDAACDDEIALAPTANNSAYCNVNLADAVLRIIPCAAPAQLVWGDLPMIWGTLPMVWEVAPVAAPANDFDRGLEKLDLQRGQPKIASDWPPPGRAKRRKLGLEDPAPRDSRKHKQPVDPPCVHLGAELGQADCLCGGKPMVYTCNKLGQPCVRQSPSKPIVRLMSGERLGQSVQPCSICDFYDSGEPQ